MPRPPHSPPGWAQVFGRLIGSVAPGVGDAPSATEWALLNTQPLKRWAWARGGATSWITITSREDIGEYEEDKKDHTQGKSRSEHARAAWGCAPSQGLQGTLPPCTPRPPPFPPRGAKHSVELLMADLDALHSLQLKVEGTVPGALAAVGPAGVRHPEAWGLQHAEVVQQDTGETTLFVAGACAQEGGGGVRGCRGVQRGGLPARCAMGLRGCEWAAPAPPCCPCRTS